MKGDENTDDDCAEDGTGSRENCCELVECKVTDEGHNLRATGILNWTCLGVLSSLEMVSCYQYKGIHNLAMVPRLIRCGRIQQ
jgi:hypothetical protein